MLNQFIFKRCIHHALTAILIVCLFGMAPILAQTPRQSTARGVNHYNDGEYDQALTEFLIGLQAAPDRSELNYDVGAAQYRLQNYPDAAGAFSGAIQRGGDQQLTGDALYNLGNTMFRAGQYEDAINAYKAALMANHDDQDAKHNLELSLRMQQMQQQQQQQQDQDQQQEQSEPDSSDQQQQQQDQDQSDTPDEQQPQPQPQQTDMSQEEARELLQAMQGDEQEAQKDKLVRQFGQPKRVERDW